MRQGIMRVILAEDHPIVRQGTRLFLESVGVPVVGEATTGTEAVRLAREYRPDVVVMDVHLPELTGVEATRRIRLDQPDVRVLVLTAYDEPAYVNALLDAGADGLVLKTAELSQLHQALLDVAVGRSAFDRDVLARAAAHEADAPPLVEGLTDRELEILQWAAQGLTNKAIGQRLFISDRTVQGHLQNVYQKLGVSTRTEAVTAGLARGLILLNDGAST
jgi:DNA-binding NarL/FixJ family response regulator